MNVALPLPIPRPQQRAAPCGTLCRAALRIVVTALCRPQQAATIASVGANPWQNCDCTGRQSTALSYPRGRSGVAKMRAQKTLYFDCGAKAVAIPIWVAPGSNMFLRCDGESRQPEKACASVW